MTALLLVAVMSTAASVHLIWQRTATRNVEKIVASLDAQSADSVRAELASTLALVAGTAEIIRSILFQGAIKADDEVKREFLFLSLLREQPAIGWIGFGFPDGRFFGSHAAPGDRIEMVEIGVGQPGKPRPLRRDIYRPIPGDVMFEERIHGESAYVALGAPWYRQAMKSSQAVWSMIDILPNGFEPSVVVSKRVELYGKYQGVVMVAVSFADLSAMLSGLRASGHGKTFVLGSGDKVIAASDASADPMPAHLRDFPKGDALAAAVGAAISMAKGNEFRTLVDSGDVGPVYVSSFALPFERWRLLTAIPRSAFAEEIDRNTRRVVLVVAGLVVLAAITAVLFSNLLFARPVRQLALQLRQIERFALDQVRHDPTFLAELNDFSLAMKRMAGGLSAFAKYMPLDVVRPLVAAGLEPAPGGKFAEVTVMFADLPGFTELTERLGPAVQPHLTNFLTLAVEAIHSEGGTVDKFIGDAVMAIWNAPTAVPDHAIRACRAAAAIRAAMHALPPVSPDRSDIRVRIGINTGTALVGNIGSAERLSYTAIGDTVNLASRLVGVAKEHGVEIVLSDMTLARTGGEILAQPLGITNVRGKAVPVQIHTLAT
ncbi:adenylate/guanylate cyclase domain-containing protein [Mesorhizobium sp. L-8-10]|uniref:adenylate/guanylate cyclase domain-containing protein n=1 Tax=Mesorhizobium sp. L-8-10 TaxID=2744523 RepID=UPI00192787A1|nr:adenylate/guanylate cyclase domain-containing protein [Mesorhizobium sp. L-8-10]BCH28707.1 adenylate/guanylate cyclase domain-containing protein [Mesorhizobium sp. L-8-10]